MIKYSVISILKTFSGKELIQFEEFIKTPFHNKNSKLIQLFDELRKYYPEYSSGDLTKENLFIKLMGKAKYKESYIRNLFSDLNIQAEKFLQYNLISKNNNYEKLFIEELKNRDLYEIAEKKVRSFEKIFNTNKARDQNYYTNKNFVFEIMSFLNVDKTLTDGYRSEQIMNTVKLFMITLMENSFYLIIEEQRVNIRHDYGFLKITVEYIENHLSDFEDSPLLMVYYNLWMCFFYNNDTDYFLKARDYFKKHFSSFTKIDKKNMYSVMQVYYINKIDSGDNSSNREFLDFMLEMLKFNVLSHTENDSININLYRNILILCMMQKETQILKKFISKYSAYVEVRSRESILAYSNAHLNFLQGNFEKTLELCNRINFSNLLRTTNENYFFKNDVKSLTMKCLYELNAFENAISHIDAYKHFLKHSKLIKDAPKRKLWNFLNCVKELIKLKTKADEAALFELKKRILNTKEKEILYSEWLLEKIEELLKVKS